MSVTFWIEGAPTKRVQPYPDQDPDFWIDEPVQPFSELNLANGNFFAMMDLVDRRWPKAVEDYGTWEAADLDRILKRLMVLLNTDQKKQLEVADVRHASGNYVVFGRDSDYVNDRLNRLLKIVKVAREHGMKVTWG